MSQSVMEDFVNPGSAKDAVSQNRAEFWTSSWLDGQPPATRFQNGQCVDKYRFVNLSQFTSQ